jgi:hypothetical protein
MAKELKSLVSIEQMANSAPVREINPWCTGGSGLLDAVIFMQRQGLSKVG